MIEILLMLICVILLILTIIKSTKIILIRDKMYKFKTDRLWYLNFFGEILAIDIVKDKSYVDKEIFDLIKKASHNGTHVNSANEIIELQVQARNTSILEEFIEKKIKKNRKIINVIYGCIFIYFFIYYVFDVNLEYWMFIFPFPLECLILLYNLLLKYRQLKGYYGTNYSEAKELLYYIKQANDKNSNNSNGKKIFNEIVDKKIEPEDLWEFLKE